MLAYKTAVPPHPAHPNRKAVTGITAPRSIHSFGTKKNNFRVKSSPTKENSVESIHFIEL